ncbi:30S ribosomal protein S18 [Candidatus Beckwithbacteria bacterium CG10_big_fil_rev_8_21_14_0_10_34_10]|uniref:Small ribosomal subunit protein bS18 n=1 Tax=Candidatus Beckwithbacteria bacterium CG10_big_fil_rev_8_21_14_0_10_34_10 TaxID=1974495 RepID=A0A2H0WAF4_9BACT|nr:MAG: 30S ribosomal protein S18 [Candidatus Beckwithbacteria bacterium CG10_big_fil_rev_8_21_14_0_10_34_10]
MREYKKDYQRDNRRKNVVLDCFFCKKKVEPEWEKPDLLKKYLYDTGKISSRKTNGNCSKHQRHVAKAIKRARHLGLLPYTQKVLS